MALNTLPNAGLTNRGYPSDRLVTPIIINGDMSVAQRGTSFSSMSNGQFITDRFFYDRAGGGVTAVFTGSQSTDVPSVLTFGPYSGAIPVVISAIGDDPNCDQTITVTSPCQACVPLGINCSLGDGFVGLVIADIDNSDSGCSEDGYGIFPELTTDLAQGATYPVSVTTGYTNQYVRAWVDFNDDYEYSLDELIIDNAT